MSNLKSALGGVLTRCIQAPRLDPGTAAKESHDLVLVLLSSLLQVAQAGLNPLSQALRLLRRSSYSADGYRVWDYGGYPV